MSGGKIYVDDVGTIIYGDAKSDISSATAQNMRIWKPTASIEATWVSSIYTETLSSYLGATGASIDNPDFDGLSLGDNVARRLKYITVSGDLSEVGKFKAQNWIEIPGWRGRGGTFDIPVIADFN